MSDLSRIAATLSDYAVSAAKNNWNEKVSRVHLVKAIRRWDTERFDSEFPTHAELVEKHLSQTKGDTLKPDGFDEDVLSDLQSVSQEDDVWILAKKLLEAVDDVLRASNSTDGQSVQTATQTSTSKQEVAKVTVTELKPLPMMLNDALAIEIANLLSEDVVEVRKVLYSDALYVARRVLGGDYPEMINALTIALGVTEIPKNAEEGISQTVSRIASLQTNDSGRIATKLALALVDIGEFAAALDENVTSAETDQIDEIRLALRAQLKDQVDVASDAIVEFEQKFSHLVGMETVKADLRKRVDFLVVSRRRQQRGHSVTKQRMHMAFVGNPGTGKTTVARLYAELLQNVGLLPSDRVIETDRSGLVAEFVGQTDKKTKEVIKSADGGVLFIDEAYALNDRYGNQKGFGEEATDALVKEMEDRRDSLVVILAGYKDPMMDFISINPGLKSRIPVIIEFPDYTDEELVEIAERISESRGLILTGESKSKIGTLMSSERSKEGFGNAREVENLLDAAQRNATLRVSHLGNLATESEIRTIIGSDIPEVVQSPKKLPIGFARDTYL
jgi:AAA+ superfamily predicted ATPase